MTIQQINDLIREVSRWNKVRARLNTSRIFVGKGPLEMGTLPRVIEALEEYRDMVRAVSTRGDIHIVNLGDSLEGKLHA
jgi:hypothetical protein